MPFWTTLYRKNMNSQIELVPKQADINYFPKKPRRKSKMKNGRIESPRLLHEVAPLQAFLFAVFLFVFLGVLVVVFLVPRNNLGHPHLLGREIKGAGALLFFARRRQRSSRLFKRRSPFARIRRTIVLSSSRLGL